MVSRVWQDLKGFQVRDGEREVMKILRSQNPRSGSQIFEGQNQDILGQIPWNPENWDRFQVQNLVLLWPEIWIGEDRVTKSATKTKPLSEGSYGLYLTDVHPSQLWKESVWKRDHLQNSAKSEISEMRNRNFRKMRFWKWENYAKFSILRIDPENWDLNRSFLVDQKKRAFLDTDKSLLEAAKKLSCCEWRELYCTSSLTESEIPGLPR